MTERVALSLEELRDGMAQATMVCCAIGSRTYRGKLVEELSPGGKRSQIGFRLQAFDPETGKPDVNFVAPAGWFFLA